MKLAVIDDSELIRNQLLRLIASQPAIELVGTAGSEDGAVALILDRQPDAVILDLALNPGSGLHVLQRIRAAGSTARVLVLTNNDDPAFRAACAAHDIAGYFDKLQAVLDCLERLFSWLPAGADANPPPLPMDPTDYRAVFDAHPDALFVVGDRGRILYANAIARQRHGCSLEEFLALRFGALASPPLGDATLLGALGALGQGEPFEWQQVDHEGKNFPVRIHAAAIRFEGQPAVLACVRDISDARLAQAQIDVQLHFAARILDVEPGTLYVYDLDTHSNVYVNRHWLNAFGYSREEIRAMGPGMPAALFHPDDLPRIRAHHEALRELADGAVGEIDYRCRARNGEWRWLHSRDTPYARNNDGRVFRILGLADDVTAQCETEARLRQMSLAFDQCVESIIVTDRRPRIEYVNDAVVNLSGYSREELLGQNPRILASGKTPRENYGALWQALDEGRSWRGEFHNRRKDGVDYVESVSISPIRAADGRVTHYVAVKEDITERKRLARELDRHREQLEELVSQRTAELEAARAVAEAANRAKSAFLATMSHEIRTPLNVVIGLTHLMRRSGVNSQQLEQLGRIDGAGQHLLALIDGILDLSKIESGALQLENIEFNLHALVDQVVSIVGRLAQDKGLQLEADLAPDLPGWLRGDPTRLRQALLNLAANAVKFTEQGSVTIVARRDGTATEAIRLRFEVVDTGPGIDAAALARLFEPFAQADRSTTRKHGGSGLGLAITRRLAERMGGSAGGESEPGRGSRFWFSVEIAPGVAPLRPAVADHDDRAAAILRTRFAGRRILVVDDEEVNRELAVELLQQAGLAVDGAAGGEQAIALARDGAYAAILMDVQMQPIDGLTTTRRIHALPGLAPTPIIALTANAFVEDRERCAEAGMAGFLTKPYPPEALFGAVLRAIDDPRGGGAA